MAIEVFTPGEFEAERHFYPRALNAQIHPLASAFFRMPIDRLVSRYCHLHPYTDRATLEELLRTPPRYLRWSGSDIFNVSTEDGVRQKLIVETNSCPSGQKSFPLLDEHKEEGGYWRLMEKTFLPLFSKVLKKSEDEGVVAVLYDKNVMESSGYAQVLATLTNRPVYFIECKHSDPFKHLELSGRRLYARVDGKTRPLLCAFRYVTQRPWTRLPFDIKTPILNPVVACLAGGRNKTSAAKAYELFNGQFRSRGLEIQTPQSFTNVRKAEVPLLVAQLGGKAVVKVPYLNAGQGIHTIVSDDELEAFMDEQHPYDEFIVQQLVGNFRWSSTTTRGKVFNIGTVPDKKCRIYAFDMRMMVAWQEERYAPVAMYARRAPLPMTSDLESGASSWHILGTNLSKKVGDEQWETEPSRLLMMDRKDFSRLGLGLDDLIEAFVQAVLANRAIDDLARKLVKRGGGFRRDLFRSLNNDRRLIEEIELGLTRSKGGAATAAGDR
ncbi:MAG: hypothetical protein D6731_17025 [Planctomycetota bacterium]|nr:MAG: hypothetical protein D6731_17025 [Planctomycetota bacterium]